MGPKNAKHFYAEQQPSNWPAAQYHVGVDVPKFCFQAFAVVPAGSGEAEKAALRAQKDAEREAARAAKEAEKEEKRALKEAEKAAREAEREAAKAEKEAEKERLRLEKEVLIIMLPSDLWPSLDVGSRVCQ